jgi:threonine dehydratase
MPAATVLERAPDAISAGRPVYLKREDAHELGAFKWRGALPTIGRYAAEGASAVVTASTGNHGAAVAWAATRHGLEAIVFVPDGTSQVKLALLAQHGATIVEAGADVDEAKGAARAFAESARLPLFEDGAEPAQVGGYAAIGEEILAQLGEPPDAVVVPVGNGALLAGVGSAFDETGTRRIGVVSEGAPAMALSWEARRPVETDRCATIADGLAVRVAIPMAVEWLVDTADVMIQVSERAIADAVVAFDDAGIRVEPAAAAALAALPRLDARTVVLVVTGRNIDDGLLARCRNDPDSFLT